MNDRVEIIGERPVLDSALHCPKLLFYMPAARWDSWRRPVADMHRACAANDMGNRTTPSYVAFTDTERLIGDAAKNQVGGWGRPAVVTLFSARVCP